MGIQEILRFRAKVEKLCAEFDRKLAKGKKLEHCEHCHDDPSPCEHCPSCPRCGDLLDQHDDDYCAEDGQCSLPS